MTMWLGYGRGAAPFPAVGIYGKSLPATLGFGKDRVAAGINPAAKTTLVGFYRNSDSAQAFVQRRQVPERPPLRLR